MNRRQLHLICGSMLAAAAIVAGIIALAAARYPSRSTAAAPTPSTATGSVIKPVAATAPATAVPTPAANDPAATRPVRLRIPSIAVDTTLQDLGLTATGALQTPSRWQRAGWYAGGVRPGNVGPAVIAGHIDSTKGPAVFARLNRLRPGATALVTRADGTVLHFVVDRADQYPKQHFPTEAVYGPSSLPLLRLITCTGTFDRSAHSYLDNLVVTTHLVAR